MKKPKPKFDEAQVLDALEKLIENQPARVQVQICILLLGRVLLHIRTDVGRKEAMNEMLTLAAITEMVEELQMPSTRKH